MTSSKTLKKFRFIKVDPKAKAPLCIDGRAGLVLGKKYGVYPQMLGGSFGFAVLYWLLNRPDESLSKVAEEVYNRLKEKGYPLGVHISTHAHPDEGKSDCGFADNLTNILKIFREKSGEIWQILNSVASGLDQNLWSQIVEKVNQLSLDNIANGSDLIDQVVRAGAILQTLEGEHKEKAAIVNIISGMTLDVDSNQDNQVFNLDLWLVEEIAQELGWEVEEARLLTLGLYVATEMVLVEQKGKECLSILVRRP